MGELAIRGDRVIPVLQYQGTVKTEKTSGSGQSQKAAGTAGYTVSESLQRLISGGVQTESQLRESRRTLQTGGAVLAEVKDSLDRIGELAEKAASGGEADRAALQTELERLVGEIERMISSASVDGTKLFQDLDVDADQLAALYLGAVIAGGGSSGPLDPEQALEGLQQLLEKVAQGVPMDQAIELLTGGKFTSLLDFQNQFASGTAPGMQEFLNSLLTPDSSSLLMAQTPLLTLLTGLEGMNFDLLMGLWDAVLNTQPAPAEAVLETGEPPANPADTALPAGGGEAPETAGVSGSEAPASSPLPLVQKQFGALQVTGRDLSGVSYNPSTEELTVSGEADVVLQGAEQGTPAVRLAGSGTVTLQNVTLSQLTVSTADAHMLSAGENTLAEVRMEEGTSLTLDGGGQLKIGLIRANETNVLRLAGGAAAVEDQTGALTVPVIVDGPVSLAVRAGNVSDPEGKALKPFDLVWKTLIPGWSGITAMELNGKQAKQALLAGDPARLWMNKGEQGYPIHTLVIEGRDKAGQLRTRYAYLRWNQQTEEFEEVSMYPNPFSVTGGEPGQDWIYEEETCTLRILSNRVTAVSGGPGVDGNQEPFSGRIALANHIGTMELALDGVVCQVPEGRAFSLGRGNDVTLLLPGGTSSLFESGAGCTGISLGDGTSLRVGGVGGDSEEPAGTLTATVGAGIQGSGGDIPILEANQVMQALSIDPAGEREGRRLWVRAGISLQMGEETVILPQFRLSSRALRLDKLNVLTQEYAQAARVIVDEDRRWVSQIQAIYDTLYDQLERSLNSLHSSRRPPAVSNPASPVQNADPAGAVVESVRRSILLQPSEVIDIHSKRRARALGQLLR